MVSLRLIGVLICAIAFSDVVPPENMAKRDAFLNEVEARVMEASERLSELRARALEQPATSDGDSAFRKVKRRADALEKTIRSIRRLMLKIDPAPPASQSRWRAKIERLLARMDKLLSENGR